MTEPLSPLKIKKTTSHNNSQTMQTETLAKRIPRHRRSKYKIKSKESSYKRIKTKQDLSRRLQFDPFRYYRKTPFDQEVSYISKILGTSSKTVDTLIFPLSGGRDVNNKMFLCYSEEIKKMRALKVFDFYAWGVSDFTDIAMKYMSIGFRSLKSLQYLKIKLVECCYINYQGIEFVAKGLRKLISLQTLDLSFDEGGEVYDEGVKALFKNLKHLRNLQTLNISFHYCGGIAWEEIGDPAKELKGLKSLKNINFHCALAEQMGSVGLGKISKMLGVLKGLESITLGLLECNVEDEDLKVLMDEIQGKEHLKKINMDLGRNYITDEGLVIMNECFQKLKVIEEIELALNDCKKITEEASEQLKKNLEGIATLKELKVKLKKEYR